MGWRPASKLTSRHGRWRIPIRALVSYSVDITLKTSLFVVYVVINKVVTPFAQHFSLNDISLQYPYNKHQRVPIYLLIIITAVCPAVVISIYVFLIEGVLPHIGSTAHKRSPYKLLQRLWELHSGCLGLLTAQGLAFVITSTLKNICGKPRPDLIARCVPISAASDAIPSGLVSKAICTQQDEGILKDGFLSFPSGHASSAFAGLFYLSLYLAAKLRVADQRGDFWRSFVVLFPTLAAACVAVTRIMDARHHGFDVLFGSALGIFCAWVAYRQYFPPISHTRKRGRAYPMKSWGKPGDRAAPEKAVLADPEKLETAQVAGEYRPTTARGNPFGNSTMTLDDRTLELGHLQLNFSTTDLQDFSGAICADAEASSDGTSLNSVAIATIERAQYAYTVPTPGLSRTPYPPQNRKPVPAFQSMHRRISSTV